MTNQGQLFEQGMYGNLRPAVADPPYEAQAAVAADLKRWGKQTAAIYRRLLQGPASNADLAQVALKYTSRISDLRERLKPHGLTVLCDRQPGGLSVYRLADTDHAE